MSANQNRNNAASIKASTNAPDDVAIAPRGNVDLSIMLAMHAAFRRDLAHLAHAASRPAADLEDPAQRTAVLAGWEVFKTQLHHHHTAEDSDLWPRMRGHLAGHPDDLALLDAMEDEHHHIVPLLDAIDSAFDDREHGHERLGDTVDALATDLPRHLSHEERDALPLVDRALTAKEWHGFEADQRRKNGIRGASQMFPWMLENASPERVHAVLHSLPPPLRVVYRHVWQPRYASHDRWDATVS
ncbi:MAG TPA: hemerythrin domain-containing protein [Micromonosporaceae bacterium]